jgi:hypothetical protein
MPLAFRIAVYITTHQQDSSQPQQSQDSPQPKTGEGLTMEETVEATLAGIVNVG